MKGGPVRLDRREERGHRNHHPLHVAALKTRAEAVGVECLAYAPAIGIEPPREKQKSLVEFFLVHLGVKRDPEAEER